MVSNFFPQDLVRKTAVLIQTHEGIIVPYRLFDNVSQNLSRPPSPLSVLERRERERTQDTEL